MKYLINIFFLYSLSLSSLYCMEHISLIKKDSSTELQKYFQETVPLIKFSEIGKCYEQLPLKLRGRIILCMSDELRMMHRIFLYLPYDVQKKIFVLYMGDYRSKLQIEGAKPTEEEEKEIEKIQKYNLKVDQAIEKFCGKKSLVKAVELYRKIRRNIRKSDSIAPLYALKKSERITLLSTLNPEVDIFIQKFINFAPIMSIKEQQAIHAMDEDMRQYFKGKVVHIIDAEAGDHRGCIRIGLLTIPMSGLVESIACCLGGVEAGCNPIVLGTALGLLPGVGCVLCMIGVGCECSIQKDNSNKVAL